MFKYTEYNAHLAEITQNMTTTFAFVKRLGRDYTNAHAFVMCRDFLGDVIAAISEKKTNYIYGFKFNGKNDTILQDKFRVVIRCPNAESKQNMLKNLPRLHEMEALVGKITKTTITQIEDGDNLNTVYVVGSKFWLKSVFNISLYTFMVKSLGYELADDMDFFKAIGKTTYVGTDWAGNLKVRQTVEAEYATAVGPQVMKLLPKLRKLHKDLDTVHGYHKGANVSTIHNSSGFRSLLSYKIGANKLSVLAFQLLQGQK